MRKCDLIEGFLDGRDLARVVLDHGVEEFPLHGRQRRAYRCERAWPTVPVEREAGVELPDGLEERCQFGFEEGTTRIERTG
jgi:hypothetical protein